MRGQLGFNFKDEEGYDGVYKNGSAIYGPLGFNLSIGKIPIARFVNKETNSIKHHAVSESEASAWFCHASKEFKHKYTNLTNGDIPTELPYK